MLKKKSHHHMYRKDGGFSFLLFSFLPLFALCFLLACSKSSPLPPTEKKKPKIETIEELSKKCQAFQEEACIRLSQLYEKGHPPHKADPKKALLVYRKLNRLPPQGAALAESLCQKDDAEACLVLAKHLIEQINSKKKLLRAKEILETRCKKGEIATCSFILSLSSRFHRAFLSLSPEVKGIALDTLCKKGDDGACKRIFSVLFSPHIKIGFIGRNAPILAYKEGEIKEWQERLIRFYTKRCDEGRGEACFLLAQAFQRGIGVEADQKKREQLLSRGCQVKDFSSRACLAVVSLAKRIRCKPMKRKQKKYGGIIMTQGGRSCTAPSMAPKDLELRRFASRRLCFNQPNEYACAEYQKLIKLLCEKKQKGACEEVVRLQKGKECFRGFWDVCEEAEKIFLSSCQQGDQIDCSFLEKIREQLKRKP